jgi:hypothetical protein
MPRHRRWHWQVSTWLDSVWAKDPR